MFPDQIFSDRPYSHPVQSLIARPFIARHLSIRDYKHHSEMGTDIFSI